MARVLAHQQQFAEQKISVVTLSFATQPHWVSSWLAETNSPFPFLIDTQRQAYQAYGLRRSAWQSWGVRALAYYAKALWHGQPLVSEKRGDAHQLGGDFLVDSAGTVRFAQPSRDPTDRPHPAELLAQASLAPQK